MPKRDIIVIGASAGGIEVLQTVLAPLPWDFPAAVFIVLHTSKDSPSLLPEILNRNSRLPVNVCSPRRSHSSRAGLCCTVRTTAHVCRSWRGAFAGRAPVNRSRPSIDALFRSASQAYGPQVIGVVLTGNLDDGAAGVVDIKARGGIAVVQDPEEALAPSMPRSALELADVDFVLPASEIGPKLVELSGLSVPEKVQSISRGGRSMVPSGHTYSCPECGGVLEEMEEGKMLRFRCRVGHIYSPDSLMADQTEAVERALWAAIRSMEEQAEFSERLANSSRKKRRSRLVGRFEEKSKISRENAAILRDLLQKTADEIFEIPQERTGTE